MWMPKWKVKKKKSSLNETMGRGKLTTRNFHRKRKMGEKAVPEARKGVCAKEEMAHQLGPGGQV